MAESEKKIGLWNGQFTLLWKIQLWISVSLDSIEPFYFYIFFKSLSFLIFAEIVQPYSCHKWLRVSLCQAAVCVYLSFFLSRFAFGCCFRVDHRFTITDIPCMRQSNSLKNSEKNVSPIFGRGDKSRIADGHERDVNLPTFQADLRVLLQDSCFGS